ncbi:antitoxin [Streptomyces antimicrobicus]|uniref:Antitoxin n=1 Tax=Streptomyces antimicrobicus TaxID=2883108 RepID=A0ABS8BEQ3_9ACTN|nr:antitoxin [Streptomyces antimicrobicus]MCB5183003.1 antitoxin [Streptomyces antimicrobicus]
MGFLDQLKDKLAPAKDKVGDLAQQHQGRIGEGLDKVAKAVDQRTKGKYHDRIATGADKAKGALGKLAHKDSPGGPTPPAGPAGPGPAGP